jgi:hypothetical protein
LSRLSYIYLPHHQELMKSVKSNSGTVTAIHDEGDGLVLCE